MNPKEQIIELHNKRYELFDVLNADFATEEEYEQRKEDLMPMIDQYADQIEDLIDSNFDDLTFEFIIEQLSNLGYAPNLLFDDNGNWAVVTQGFQNLVYGDEPEDVHTTFFVHAEQWKPTPREALRHYLEN